MKNSIKVKCVEGFEIFNNDKGKTLSAVVEGNKIYEATLYKLTEEYFAKDPKGREFLVGEINIDGELSLEKDFILLIA